MYMHTLAHLTISPCVCDRWCESTLSFFPATLRQSCSTPSPAIQLLAKVEDEAKRFQLSSEIEQTRLFTETESTSLFLWYVVVWCVLVCGVVLVMWCML